MAITTSVELGADGRKERVFHARVAPPDARLRDGGGNVTHTWTHPYDERDGCDACQGFDRLPAGIR